MQLAPNFAVILALIPMIPLSGMTPDIIADVLQTVPRYGPTDFRSLVENTIGAIHQISRFSMEKQESRTSPIDRSLFWSVIWWQDGLCISNRTLTAKGGVGSNEPGFAQRKIWLFGANSNEDAD
jgi:hypothetical protein